MENTFQLTAEHTTMLNSMNDETKTAARDVVNTLGYYQSIQFFMDELTMDESKAKLLADLGCYVIE